VLGYRLPAFVKPLNQFSELIRGQMRKRLSQLCIIHAASPLQSPSTDDHDQHPPSTQPPTVQAAPGHEPPTPLTQPQQSPQLPALAAATMTRNHDQMMTPTYP